uniref:CHK kinase-like domain-containing protein n=1 Tax=Megaselia scalaris TaxID=36166 RepID=T1H3R7_MEGSC
MIQETLAKTGDNTQIACKCIYTSMEPHQILIFEDLTKKNYKPVSGIEGSLPIVKIALSKLARYHAVCFKTNSETGEIKKDYEKIQFDVEKLKQMPMFRDGFPFFLDMLKTIPDLKEYVPIFERIAADKPVDKAYSMFDDCKANWMILTHGDFHLKNIMLSEKEDGSVDDVLLIDFQACCWGPAITDITYMLYMMLDTKTRLERRDEVIYHYYKEFTETLRRINFTGEFPKLTDLYKDILSFKDYGERFLL